MNIGHYSTWMVVTLLAVGAVSESMADSNTVSAVGADSPAKELPGAGRCVLLLHGLARTSRSMRPVAKVLREAGWQVVNRGYPSRSATIQTLSAEVAAGIAECRSYVDASLRIDVVTHSMGGLLLREWAAETHLTIGRAVMLGPPNQGSELVDRLGRTLAFRLYNGPAGIQLGTDVDAHWRRLPAVNFELGVIAGSGGEHGLLGRHVAAPNDGKVSVASTRVAGMQDHATVRVGHTFMMGNASVQTQIKTFLASGKFAAQ